MNYNKYLSIKKILKEIKPLLERAYILVQRIQKLYRVLKKNLEFIIYRITKYKNKKRFKKLDLKKREIVYLLRKNIKIK